MRHRKADRHGVATELRKRVQVRSERDVQWGGAPCAGFLALYEDPEHTGVVDIIVRPVFLAKKSRRKCHNPWPAHVHDDERARQRKRAARRK